MALLLSACGGGGGSDLPSHTANPAPPPVTQTTSVTLVHGLGYVCWLQGTSPENIWCWASEQAAIDNGDAGQVGLTDLNPVLLYSAPGTTTFTAYDHGLCYFSSCIGSQLSTVNVWQETRDCDITSADTLHCAGEANPDLTFPGITLSRIEHSPTYLNVRRTCEFRNTPEPHIFSEGASGRPPALSFGGAA